MDDAVVLVGMGVEVAGRDAELRELADAVGASVAYLQNGDPALIDELSRLHESGTGRITLVGMALGGRAPARSWLRRVAGHWARERPDGPTIVIAGREVAGREAGLSSPAWEDVPGHRHHVLVCRGPRCSAQGAAETSAALDAELRERGLGDDDVLVTQTGCLFPCNHAPVIVVHPADAWYGAMDASAVRDLIDAHLVGGEAMVAHRLHSPRRGAPPA